MKDLGNSALTGCILQPSGTKKPNRRIETANPKPPGRNPKHSPQPLLQLTTISLTNFKNYHQARFEFGERIIGICGS